MGEFVRVDVEGGIATVRLDRPPVNALNRHAVAELRDAAHAVGARTDVAAVLLWGGPTVFGGGGDVAELARLTPVQAAHVAAETQDAFTALARIPKPVVAAVCGYALGGGLELALTADFRICGDNARFGQPEILLGLVPGAGGTQRLPRLVGAARAKDLVLTGRTVDAHDALAMGLVDRVVAPDDVHGVALELAQRFVDGPAVALAAAKRAIDDGLGLDLDAGLRLESTLFAALFATDDMRNGTASFLEHGPGKARFRGL